MKRLETGIVVSVILLATITAQAGNGPYYSNGSNGNSGQDDGRSASAVRAPELDQRVEIPQTPEEFVVDDQVVSDPSVSLVDMEFNQLDGLFVWQDSEQNLWIGQVDLETGDFIPKSGKGQLIATGLARMQDTGNGPEWIYTPNGAEIVFTVKRPRMMLARAYRDGESWKYETLPNAISRSSPVGTKDYNDPKPRILYWINTPKGRFPFWRELYDPTTEEQIPNESYILPSWVSGERAMVIKTDFDGIQQCALYDIDTHEKTQISFDAQDKRFGFAWRAPEFENQWVAFCLNSHSGKLGIYRKIDGKWEKTSTITPPSRMALYSPEYFIYNGRSYIFFSTLDDPNPTHFSNGDVWIVGIDPDDPFQRQVSSPTDIVRLDPEVFFTTQGPFIYYTERTPDGVGITHRSATGLGPPQ
jgi:hypothetical protein